MKKTFIILFVLSIVFTACENQEWEFPDFDYSTVYFAYQSPVRTLVLGKDYTFDNILDNEHKCQIMATLGGVYENKKDIKINVVVDNSLCDSLRFESPAGDSVIAMPSGYYSLPENMQILIPSGKMIGGIEVLLTDAFFNDPRSVKNSFVIPLRMTKTENVDSILSGQSEKVNPNRIVSADWTISPKDYILYAVKYINNWHGYYLRRGIDIVKGNNGNSNLDTTNIYHKQYVEKDEVCKAQTKSMKEVILSMVSKEVGNINRPFYLTVRFDESNNCTVSNPDTVSYTITGNGKFVENGDFLGNEKRNVIYLKYSVDFGTTTHDLTDTLVLRDRGVKFETFVPAIQ